MTDNELLQELDEAAKDLLCDLRFGRGLDESKKDRLCAVLSKCAAQWRQRDSIPKRAANWFVDMSCAMMCSADEYEAKESERIKLAEDRIAGVMRDCVRLEQDDSPSFQV